MMQMVWLLAFMLIPVWIPIIAVTTGAIFDRLRPSPPSELTQRMAALQAGPKAHLQVVSKAHLHVTPEPAPAS